MHGRDNGRSKGPIIGLAYSIERMNGSTGEQQTYKRGCVWLHVKTYISWYSCVKTQRHTVINTELGINLH